jgi:hypothetical protein
MYDLKTHQRGKGIVARFAGQNFEDHIYRSIGKALPQHRAACHATIRYRPDWESGFARSQVTAPNYHGQAFAP